jgi:hypothetical protein
MERETHAIVIGGSMAGLLTARVLSQHFARVTLVERDPLCDTPEARKGQPQARHLHALLGNGSQLLERFFPGLLDELSAGGAVVTDAGETMRWYCLGGYRARLTYGSKTVLASRTFLEWRIRQRVASLPAVSFRDGCAVEGLAASPDRARITGVYLRPPGGEPELLQADLVIDASGRGAAAPRWLETLGYQAPPEQSVRVNVGYATQTLRRDPDDPVGNFWHFITPEAPAERRVGAVLPVDGERWIVTLGGWFGDHPPTDEAGFLSFARSLPAPDVADLIARCEPLDAIIPRGLPLARGRRCQACRCSAGPPLHRYGQPGESLRSGGWPCLPRRDEPAQAAHEPLRTEDSVACNALRATPYTCERCADAAISEDPPDLEKTHPVL